MSALVNFSLRVDKLPKQNFIKGKNGAVYVNLTASINNDTNQYGQNVSFFVSQSKEERENKKDKLYIGNGQVVWNDGEIKNAEKKQEAATVETDTGGDFPF
jgi:hypothetical protein